MPHWPTCGEMATMHPLISTTELAHRLDEVVLNDIRWALTGPDHGRQDYEAGHIPGAVFVDLDTDLSSEPGSGRHPLPDPGVFAQTLGRLGIGPSDEVVVYDDADHGFHCDQRATYNEAASKDAWQRVTSLFAAELGS